MNFTNAQAHKCKYTQADKTYKPTDALREKNDYKHIIKQTCTLQMRKRTGVQVQKRKKREKRTNAQTH